MILLSPLYISIKTAILSTIITFFLGIYLANFVKKIKRFRSFFDALFTLPMVLPPTVIGFILLLILGANGPLEFLYEKYNFQIVFSYTATVISAVVVSLPLMYRTALSSFLQIDEEYIQAARTLGLSEYKIFWKIIFPLSKEGLIAGMVLSFTRALGEFGATIMISGNIVGKTQTISTAIYTAVQSGQKDLAFQWSLIVICISLLSIIALSFVTKNKYR
ncbi:MAG: molybdate ABC transporter permease subunit [Fusobacterium sp.]|nr:molybdate ABC transporter permease subunit [Fusobacterium sp.]